MGSQPSRLTLLDTDASGEYSVRTVSDKQKYLEQPSVKELNKLNPLKSLRDSFPHLPELSDEDFKAARKGWELKTLKDEPEE